MNVTFYGVRGSTPCPAEENRRYGGNTACVALEVAGEYSAAPGPGGEPICEWLEVRPFYGSAPTVAE